MKPGDVISYLEMCAAEEASLQRGMNFRLGGDYSVILMSRRPGAPYIDRVVSGGRTLIYEGHDVPKCPGLDPKAVDQQARTPSGTLTQNGLFSDAAQEAKKGSKPELVKVYEKIRDGIWTYNGVFQLVDSWRERSGRRRVFKFRLEICDTEAGTHREPRDTDPNRLIPSATKLEVWKRDRGKCVRCGAEVDLHFDHIIPYSKGGSSTDPRNIQLLCGRHNIAKAAKIE